LKHDILHRLELRRAPLVTGVVSTVVFTVLGSVSPLLSIAVLAVLGAWAMFWPLSPDRVDTDVPPAQAREWAAGADLWRSMLDGIPEPAFILDAQKMIIAVNRATEGVIEARAGQHVAQASRAPELLRAIDAALGSRTAQIFSMHVAVPVERTISGWVTPLAEKSRSGEPAALIVARDLTEQGRLAQMRADFVANASHELRTPLAVLKGFVETLQLSAKDDPAARERFLAIMSEQAERMTHLIDDLLSLSRIEMRAHLPPRGVVDLNEVTGRVIVGLQALATAADVALVWDPLPEAADVRGDGDELAQAIQNLVENAIKYGRRGGHVDVKLSAETDKSAARQPRARWFALVVNDDGPGIAREHLPRLTERFYRVSVGASRDKGGTGLGLAIVKHIVARHDGELRIESTFGKGSTFTIRLRERSREPVAMA
jgi:two-component system phosphate regulon sensor histidine kinase PhoR